MFIHTFPSGLLETNAYLLLSQQDSRAIIIDPAPGSFEVVFPFAEKNHVVIDQVWLTHSHWDHIADVAQFKRTYSATVAIHADDAENLINPGSDGLSLRGLSIEGVVPDKFFAAGDVLQLGDIAFEVIETPGHTPGGVCFYAPTEKVLFSGDTLFKGSIGTLALPTARPAMMWSSLRKLAELPGATKVYPGHGPATSIAAESWLPRAQELFS